jgi:hypothetical protein
VRVWRALQWHNACMKFHKFLFSHSLFIKLGPTDNSCSGVDLVELG